MKLRLLLLMMFLMGVVYAQEPYRNLIITEARMDGQPNVHVELTNMGDQAINLSEFKFVLMRPWIPDPGIVDPWEDPWIPEGNRMFMLPDVVLEPGESYVLATAYDFGPAMYQKRVDGFDDSFFQRRNQIEMQDLADFLIHIDEPNSSLYPNVQDSVTTSERYGDNYQWVFETWGGRGAFMIEHHFAEGDSAAVDQVGGVFDNDGKNFSHAYDVAGVTDATGNSLLVRKYSIKNGNLNFDAARGVGLEDSEWMPITRPSGYDNFRKLWWTVGNHGPYVLDENTLVSDIIDVDFATKTLIVPWGVRRLDDIMNFFEKREGLAWNYQLNSFREDSVYRAAKTGDKLIVHVVGNELQTDSFEIVVADPTADANIVVPVAHVNIGSVWEGGALVTNTQNGILDWPRVTQHNDGNDTITGEWHGLPNALRTDSLMKYLEKPSNATWEFIFVDDAERPDLKDGDLLRVTSENGTVKDYYLQVQPYGPSHNASLSSITWPDIPDFYKGVFGWVGDTIPGFNSTTLNYRVTVPYDVDGIPALVAKPQSLNADVQVNRAASLKGSVQDRTTSFHVTAEDDSVQNTYNVELVMEKDPTLPVQPYEGEPFISEYVWWDQWSNVFMEIVNPGNQPLDLSDYMIASEDFLHNPAGTIENFSGEDDYDVRYAKYIPGYKYVSSTEWSVNPGILVQDLSVNAIVQPGDVFVLGAIDTDGQLPTWNEDYRWPVIDQMDVQFYNREGNNTYTNTMGEEIENEWTGNPIRKWSNGNIYLYKILNDSIKNGLKAPNDPNDFELIEVFGMGDGSDWIIGGQQAQMITTYKRKSHVQEGNPEYQGSFGTNWEDSEWIKEDQPFWQARNVGWPYEILNIVNDIGQHFMDEPTHYKSTVTSRYYNVSPGFSMEEEIIGVVTGTTTSNFISNLAKADEGQSLTVMSGDTELGNDDILNQDDVLVVLSADSTNTTHYTLHVSEEGLNSNAVLTSDVYDIEIETQPKSAAQEDENAGFGVIRGMEYGTQLRTVVENIEVPQGASMDIVDEDGAYVTLTQLNFDTVYVNATVNANTYFDVTAEDGITRIMYQLQPNSTEEDAFILSDVYSILQSENLVTFVPRGTSVPSFLANVTPALGATVKVVDKMGYERTEGTLYEDDKIVVTSQNGMVTRVYHLGMLRTQYITGVEYLAYVLSDDYKVDQVDYDIEGPTNETSIDDFYARITPSMGATAVVVDADGNEKTSGSLAQGDLLRVTSADGRIVVTYDLEVTVVSSKLTGAAQIEIYPNPTNGKLNVRGVEAGNRIQVYTSTGAMIRDMKVQSSLEMLSLDGQPSGIYMIIVSKNNNELLGRYKVSKR